MLSRGLFITEISAHSSLCCFFLKAAFISAQNLVGVVLIKDVRYHIAVEVFVVSGACSGY